jgi:hypothetical protein
VNRDLHHLLEEERGLGRKAMPSGPGEASPTQQPDAV